MLTQELLDILWDFRDPPGSEERFRNAILSDKYDDVEQAEFATQLARALGLQGRFDEAKAILAEVTGSGLAQDQTVRIRLLLERGRILHSSGHPALSISVFESAASLAEAAQLWFLGVDALHMLAIVDPNHADNWTLQALELASAAGDPRTRRWAVTLYSDRGWLRHEADDYWSALHEFRLAKIAADECGTDEQQRTAGWAIGRCLRSIGRYEDALEIQEELAKDNPDDGYVNSELRALRQALTDQDAQPQQTS